MNLTTRGGEHMRVASARRTRVTGASVLTLALAAALATISPTASASLALGRTDHRATVQKVKVDPRLFGVHDAVASSLHRSGTGSIRLWDSGTMWKDIFPTADSPNWTRLDSLVQQAHDNGTEVTLVLGTTPAYAAADPADPAYATSMPDLAMYTAYVHDVMSRYSTLNWGSRGIAAYQFWTEANIHTFWTAPSDQLGQLVKAVHDVREEADPGAKV